MISRRLGILIATAAGLAGLVWLDGTGQDRLASVSLAERDIAAHGTATDSRRATLDGDTGGELRNPLSKLRRETLRQTVERPLFSQSRRPPPKPRAVAKRPSPPPPKLELKRNYFKLLGIMRGDESMIALMSDKRNGRYFRVQSGDHIDGWRVAHIGSREVALTHEEQRVTLSLPGN